MVVWGYTVLKVKANNGVTQTKRRRREGMWRSLRLTPPNSTWLRRRRRWKNRREQRYVIPSLNFRVLHQINNTSSIDRSVTDSRPFILALGNSSLFIILGLLPPMAQTQTEGGPLQSTFSSNHAASSSMTENKPSKLPVSKARHSLCSRPHNGPETPDPLVQRKSALMWVSLIVEWAFSWTMLSVVFALSIWSFYVIVGRVCTPMIRNRSASDLGRSVGGA